jgi:hypothetical protein
MFWKVQHIIIIALIKEDQLYLSVAGRFGTLEGLLFAYEPKPIKGNP